MKTSKTGYKKNSKDKGESALRIPSGRITMKGVPHPVLGTDNFGNQIMMLPDQEYQFPGSEVTEVPLNMQQGGTTALLAANMEAKRFSVAHGLVPGENAYVDKVPQYVNFTGKVVPPNQSYSPNSSVQSFVPPEITDLEWDASKNLPYYLDPHTGDLVYTKQENFYSPRFKKSQSMQDQTLLQRSVAVKKKGGKILKAQKGKSVTGPDTTNGSPTEQPTQTGTNLLPFLNQINFGLTKFSEHLASKELQNYERKMSILQGQQTPYTPEGENQYGNSFVYQSGGVIPQDMSYLSASSGFDYPSFPGGSRAPSVRTPTGNNPSTVSSTPAPAPVTSAPSPELSSTLMNYANRADKFLKAKAPHTDITGSMLAAGAQIALQKYGKLVPVELALAQLQLEGYLAKGGIKNRPQRTKNPFNVGNTDNGSNVSYSDPQRGINRYYELIASSYLKSRDPQALLQNFVNSKGSRYATDPNYESKLKGIISKENFKKGGTYEMTATEINQLKKAGYSLEIL